uniref:Thiamine diphosphokinase n=1 Tax=Panagrolaimus superbus TaxID=310955 RepID=A0A914YTY8_9BILA
MFKVMSVIDFSRCLSPSRAIAILTNSPFALLPAKWQEIWSKAAFRCATDGAANHLRPFCESQTGLKLPHLVSGDFDSISDHTKKYLSEKNVEIIETEDQNDTDLTKLIKLVCDRKDLEWDAIFILGGFGGRFDHTMASLNSLLKSHEWTSKHVFLLDHENLTTMLHKGQTKVTFTNFTSSLFSKSCGLIPIVQRETIVSLKGFQWNLDKFSLEFGGLISTSNNIVLEEVEIETNEPLMFTLEADWKMFNV